jgi:hypothetical protein
LRASLPRHLPEVLSFSQESSVMKPHNKMVAAVLALGLLMAIGIAVATKGPAWRKKAQQRHQEDLLARLTPEQAIALCGNPIQDETQTSQPAPTRRLIIRNDYSLAVELDFTASPSEPQNWRLAAIQDPSGEIKYQTPATQIGVLPCLDPKPAKKLDQKQQ